MMGMWLGQGGEGGLQSSCDESSVEVAPGTRWETRVLLERVSSGGGSPLAAVEAGEGRQQSHYLKGSEPSEF